MDRISGYDERSTNFFILAQWDDRNNRIFKTAIFSVISWLGSRSDTFRFVWTRPLQINTTFRSLARAQGASPKDGTCFRFHKHEGRTAKRKHLLHGRGRKERPFLIYVVANDRTTMCHGEDSVKAVKMCTSEWRPRPRETDTEAENSQKADVLKLFKSDSSTKPNILIASFNKLRVIKVFEVGNAWRKESPSGMDVAMLILLGSGGRKKLRRRMGCGTGHVYKDYGQQETLGPTGGFGSLKS
ncbi:hypothetical protein HNY73_007733 [Argiope bruennichi]|uniref:Uncharacterized protein n=1 Tax=Argiope bruennichi TaxID=94029 RepID=A0A8T0FM07_ARGBR|nr:hypothetical protein HNY73_007733 [Argiope bruennichi]